MGSLSNDSDDKQNNNYACPSPFFCISWPSFHDCDMKPPNFTCLLYGVGEHSTEISVCLSFSKLRYDPFGFNPGKFHQNLTY